MLTRWQQSNVLGIYTYLYLSNKIANTYANPTANGNIMNPAIAAPRTNQGLMSKYLAMPAHTLVHLYKIACH
jgi:hypothetical protein